LGPVDQENWLYRRILIFQTAGDNMQHKTKKHFIQPAACFAALAALAACGSLPGTGSLPQLSAAAPATLNQCEALAAQFKFDNTQIEASTRLAPGALTLAGKPIAAHCLVKGAMHQRKGSDGQDYAIGFEARLPQDWNGRFFYQANGGIDGVVQVAQGALGGGPLTGALAQGFATLSSDAGHNGRQNPRFGADPQARADYGYAAVGKLTPMAKSLIAAAYGKGPDRSYIGGCSNGGRHAMVAASRYGDQYDGYLVGAPGYRLPNAALAQLWAAPQWKALATEGATVNHPFAPNVKIPDLGSALTATERQTVANAILARCDALDGAKDGLVQDVKACQAAFNLNTDVATCSGARNGQCLSSDQKRVLGAVYTGGKTSSGQAIYSSFPWDAGIASPNWAQWKFVNAQVLDPAAGYIFMNPTRSIDPFNNDVDDGFKAIYAKADAYQESADDVITPVGKDNPTNMASLRARGAKMVLYHGVSDAIFSAHDTSAWMDRLNLAQSGNAASFARYFPVPGMAHCSAGPSADQFDMLTPLVNWVERGIAPQSVVASARGAGNAGGANAELPADWSATRTRPLCAYPAVARYNGSGSIEDAANFSCKN
jgi:Tannase and feruloyl esterase